MALKSRIAKLEEVAEAIRTEYTKGDDGLYYLNVDQVEELPAVRGLKTKRDELLGTIVTMNERFKGIDPEEVKSLKAKLEANNKGGKNDEMIEQLNNTIAQMKAAAIEEKSKLQGDLDKTRQEKDRYIIKNEIKGACVKLGAKPMFLEHHIEGKLVVRDGKVLVVDSSGNPKIKNSMNDPMTIEDLVTEMKQDPEWAPAFASDAKSGSGATGSSNGSMLPGTFSRKEPGAFLKNAEGIIKGTAKGVD